MNCKTCGGEARPLHDEYKGERYVVMWWCDECDEEVHPPSTSVAEISKKVDVKYLKKDMLGGKE